MWKAGPLCELVTRPYLISTKLPQRAFVIGRIMFCFIGMLQLVEVGVKEEFFSASLRFHCLSSHQLYLGRKKPSLFVIMNP